ncbi:hypothetical protein C8R44DRAFT_860575 [Mycena epipterygia]|nr:hypothetical protein C8R44DRAFT_860575 [Mycena epipterygia]
MSCRILAIESGDISPLYDVVPAAVLRGTRLSYARYFALYRSFAKSLNLRWEICSWDRKPTLLEWAGHKCGTGAMPSASPPPSSIAISRGGSLWVGANSARLRCADYWEHWEAGAKDFLESWAEADDSVARKRKSRDRSIYIFISTTCYWLKENVGQCTLTAGYWSMKWMLFTILEGFQNPILPTISTASKEAASVHGACHACRKPMPRKYLKTCKKCYRVNYCQRTEWPEHQLTCSQAPDNNMTIRLGRRLPNHLYFHAHLLLYPIRAIEVVDTQRASLRTLPKHSAMHCVWIATTGIYPEGKESRFRLAVLDAADIMVSSAHLPNFSLDLPSHSYNTFRRLNLNMDFLFESINDQLRLDVDNYYQLQDNDQLRLDVDNYYQLQDNVPKSGSGKIGAAGAALTRIDAAVTRSDAA